MIYLLCGILSLDVAGFAHGDLGADLTAGVALVIAIIALAIAFMERRNLR